jgi:tetratricopeptide (TPR) repeat protein
MARIDGLSPTAREVVQMASLLGRDFPLELLAATITLDPIALERALEELEDAGLLSQSPQSRSRHFRHALIQELVHGSLLRRRRREAHVRIVSVMQSRFPERVAAEPEVFAWQCEMAGLDAEAANHYELAGRRALEASAHHEAFAQFNKAIELNQRRPESTEQERQELGLRVAICVPLFAIEGYGSVEAARSNSRARELCRSTGEGAELYQALSGLHLYHIARAELPEAEELARELLAFGERSEDPFIRQWGHFFCCVPHYYRGEFEAARQHAEHAIALRDAQPKHSGYLHEHDAVVSALVYSAMSLWNLSHDERALARIEQAIERGSQSSHPWNRASALGFATLLHHMRREPAAVIRRAEETIAISENQGFPMWLGLGAMLRGWARSSNGIDASEEVARGLQESSASATRIEGPRVLSILAETYWISGKTDEAIQTIHSALAFSSKRACRYWDAELYRLLGVFELQAATIEQGEESLRKGLAIALEQGSHSLRLRAASSLAAHLGTSGRGDEARACLRDALASMQDDSPTPDREVARSTLLALAE